MDGGRREVIRACRSEQAQHNKHSAVSMTGGQAQHKITTYTLIPKGAGWTAFPKSVPGSITYMTCRRTYGGHGVLLGRWG
jgi:hypothetical protein